MHTNAKLKKHIDIFDSHPSYLAVVTFFQLLENQVQHAN